MLPETGSISMSQVNVELKKTETSRISLNDSDVRKLADRESGTIAMSDLRGKKASESVENYVLFNGSFKSNKDSPKNFSFDLNIPKNIIKGNFIVSMVKSGDKPNGEGSRISSVNIPDIVSLSGLNESKTVSKESFNKKVIKCSGSAGNGGYRHGNGSTMYFENTTTVIIKFTGEWEV